jgi:hypothetical protein
VRLDTGLVLDRADSGAAKSRKKRYGGAFAGL